MDKKKYGCSGREDILELNSVSCLELDLVPVINKVVVFQDHLVSQ